MQSAQEPPESQPPSPTMRRFFAQAAAYKRAFIVFWANAWSWVPVAAISGIASQFGYGAMTEGRYIVALLLYLFIIGLVAARAAYHFRSDPRHREIKRIITVLAITIFAALAYWTYSAHSKKQAQDRQLNELTDLVRGEDRLRPERILERYPLGYVIYELNYSNQVFPYANRLLKGYVIDWPSTQILHVSEKTVTIQIPNITNPETRLTFNRMRVTLPREVGASMGAIGIDGINESVEIVAIRETGFVFLIGFTETPEEFRPRPHRQRQ